MKKRIKTWLCIMLAFCGQASAQQITADNRPLTEVLQQVQQQTKYRFYWIASETAGINVSVNTDAKDIHQLMKALLEGTGLRYTVHDDRTVFLLKNKNLMTVPPLFAQEEGTATDGSLELLLSGKQKATSGNKIYAVGKPGTATDGKIVKLTGTITSFKTGEPVTGVNLVVKTPAWSAAVSDANGRYVLKVPQGEVDVEMTGIGIIDTHRRLMVYENGTLDIELEDKTQTLEEVTVTANKVENVKGVQMGIQALVAEDMKTIPTAFGELDVIKVVQALPGVKTVGEAAGGGNMVVVAPEDQFRHLRAAQADGQAIGGIRFPVDQLRRVPPQTEGDAVQPKGVVVVEGLQRQGEKAHAGGVGVVGDEIPVEVWSLNDAPAELDGGKFSVTLVYEDGREVKLYDGAYETMKANATAKAGEFTFTVPADISKTFRVVVTAENEAMSSDYTLFRIG